MTATTVTACSVVISKGGVDIDHTFEVLAADITLDDRASIYGKGTLTLAPIPASVLEQLDPKLLDLRAAVTLEQDSSALGTQSRTFDLLITGRTRRTNEQIIVSVYTDEALLELRGRVDDDLTSLGDVLGAPGEGSARAVIDELLADYADGATLEAGTVDADMPRLIELTNLLDNPDAESGLSNWTAGGGASLTQVTASALEGTYSFRITKTGSSGNCYAEYTDDIDVEAFAYYAWSLLLRSNSNRQIEMRVTWLTGKGTTIRSDTVTDSVMTSKGDNVGRVYTTGPVRAPKRARRALVRITAQSAAVSEAFVFDRATFVRVPDEVASTFQSYPSGADFVGIGFIGSGSDITTGWSGGMSLFDPGYPYPVFTGGGDAESSASPYYDYAWEASAHASPSIRTPNVDIAFDARLHLPGRTALQAAKPAIDATGGRLFCDEARDWRLVDDTYAVAGSAISIVEGDNLINYEDSISVTETEDGIPATFTGVVIEYTEIVRNSGKTIRRYDVAGDASGRVYTLNYGTAAPEPGAAAALLALATGRGHSINPTAQLDLNATPGRALTLTIGSVDYVGVISRVVFKYGLAADSDRIVITPRELEVAP